MVLYDLLIYHISLSDRDEEGQAKLYKLTSGDQSRLVRRIACHWGIQKTR